MKLNNKACFILSFVLCLSTVMSASRRRGHNDKLIRDDSFVPGAIAPIEADYKGDKLPGTRAPLSIHRKPSYKHDKLPGNPAPLDNELDYKKDKIFGGPSPYAVAEKEISEFCKKLKALSHKIDLNEYQGFVINCKNFENKQKINLR